MVKAISITCTNKGSHKVNKSFVGTVIKLHNAYPIGHGRYKDFHTYSHAAAELGYVILTGHHWIQSTGILEKFYMEHTNPLKWVETDPDEKTFMTT